MTGLYPSGHACLATLDPSSDSANATSAPWAKAYILGSAEYSAWRQILP